MATRDVQCSACGAAFTIETGFRSGMVPLQCQPCRVIRDKRWNREKTARWRAAHPEKAKAVQDRYNAKRLADPEHLRQKRENEAKRLYGIGSEELRQLTDAQGGLCAVCGLDPVQLGRRGHHGRLHIDHSHLTGQIRGLLCGNCNTMIGLSGESPEILRKAIEYLIR